MFHKDDEVSKYKLFFAGCVIIWMLFNAYSESKTNSILKEFRKLYPEDILEISLEQSKVKKIYNDLSNINNIMSIFEYNGDPVNKEKRVYPISLDCEIKTKNGKIYRFDLMKDKYSDIVMIFIKTDTRSIFINGRDPNFFLDEFNEELFSIYKTKVNKNR